MSNAEHIQCRYGAGSAPVDVLQSNPCGDGDFPEVRYDLERLGREIDRDSLSRGPASLWRYSALLPIDDPAAAVSLGEGWTPLLELPALGARMGCARLLAKDEGRNPSGTFKDRGASVAISRYRELGAGTLVHNSSGNAGAAWALYAARAGMRCVNLLPTDVLLSCMQQSTLAGADTFILDGPWQKAGATVAAAAAEQGWVPVGTLKEPYRLEGKKTMGYEIAEQLDWTLPDVIVYPVGGGMGPIAVYKAFHELQALGWVPSGPLPKLVVTQYEGCAPIVRAFERGETRATLWTDLDVLPGGLKSTAPPGDRGVLDLLAETGGTGVTVSSEVALDTAALMTRMEGLFPCPESATTIAGLATAIERGIVGRDERIVVLVTGSGLKSIPVMPACEPVTIRPGQGLGPGREYPQS